MCILRKIYFSIIRNLREKLNPFYSNNRLKKLEELGGNKHFTIISNNCWGGHVYRFFGLPYYSPTIGLYFFAHDYIKFIYNMKSYLNKKLVFISLSESKYSDILRKRTIDNQTCPIGKIDDIEIIFLHYKSKEEAQEKWERRKKRINWDNIIYKFAEMNECEFSDLVDFDNFPVEKKIVFVTKDYGLRSQVIFKEYRHKDHIVDDTNNFKKYVNLYKLISGK